MVSTSHFNAQFYFGRDVECIQRFFTKRFRLHFDGVPVLETDVERKQDLDTEIKASGCFGASAEQLAAYDKLNEEYLESRPTDMAAAEQNADGEVEGEDQAEDENDEECKEE